MAHIEPVLLRGRTVVITGASRQRRLLQQAQTRELASEQARDPDLARRLWERSAQLTDLAAP